MPQTYCTAEHLEFVLSEAGLAALLDDDETGDTSVSEEALIETAISWSATEINAAVEQQYKLSDVASNTWLQMANAILACDWLARRRRNPVEENGPIGSMVRTVREKLAGIRWGKEHLPEQAPSFNHLPTVSNFVPHLGARNGPVLVDKSNSVGSNPAPGIEQNASPFYGPWW
jgi:hypothetical protein